MEDKKEKDLLKPLFDGIFGKQRRSLYERPVFKERDMAFMLKRLSEIPLLDWYHYVFSREPLVGKIPEEKQRAWMESCWNSGAEWAERISEAYGTRDAAELGVKLGMEVSFPDTPESGDRVMFAEFREPNQIRVFMDAITKARGERERQEVQEILKGADLVDVLIAHELFHSIEEKYKKEIYSKTEKLCLWSVGPFRYTSEVVALSEISAMSFAYHFTGIQFSPYLLDVLLVHGYSASEASGLYEEMMHYAGRDADVDREEEKERENSF